MSYDRIITSRPINAQAARQLSPGENWAPAGSIVDWYDDIPPLQRMDPAAHRNPNFIDFTGRSFGYLRVVGLMAKGNPKRPASWVCRCVCGCYCSRTAKSLRVAADGGNSFVPKCGRCIYQDKLRNGWRPNLKKVRAREARP